MNTKQNAVPAGAVRIALDSIAPDYEPRTGAERVQVLDAITDHNTGEVVEQFAIWPGNRNAKGAPEYGPLLGEDKTTGKRWAYWTHSVPSKDTPGAFVPCVYDLYPPLLAERVDDAAKRRELQPAALRDAIAAHRRAGR